MLFRISLSPPPQQNSLHVYSYVFPLSDVKAHGSPDSGRIVLGVSCAMWSGLVFIASISTLGVSHLGSRKFGAMRQ